ncbi:MAG: hypothetical protein FWF51_09155 [Chitinivibrionia bacterium]|nr:hypothetical protein [Chitinivibrionia bacterium]
MINMQRFADYEWIEELAAEYDSPDEIPVADIADLAEIVGVEAAIKTFKFFDGIPQFFPKKNITEMEKEYIRRCSVGQSDKDLAKKFNKTLRYVQYIMASPAKKSDEHIPMFPEYNERKFYEKE